MTPPQPGSAAIAPAWKQGFIAGPAYDTICFILSPVLALLAAFALGRFTYPFESTDALAGRGTRIGFFIAVWTSSHLVAVFFRSHFNRQIFRMHRARFVVVPIVLTIAIAADERVRIVGAVLAGLWDVYHSSMQNFGIGRIYDAKRGNDARTGRRLDMLLNHLLYIGPIIGGLSLMATLSDLKSLLDVGWAGPVHLAAWMELHQPTLRTIIVVAGLLFLGGYVVRYWQLQRAGYRVSAQKIALIASVGVSSIWAWGFLPPIEAVFVSNLYHAFQYFALVWWIERKNMKSLFRVTSLPGGAAIALVGFLAVIFLLGLGIEYSSNTYLLHGGLKWFAAAALVCSLVHFWYDGFIWSVRRKEV